MTTLANVINDGTPFTYLCNLTNFKVQGTVIYI